ncbi:MAG: HEAT repeat domain-containing protein [Candidatus Hydrogenedentota bacterium]|nr:MAG: HEAT repeat domain-containing protein [Candidatus Hydrogenedentota bacterium]
MSSFSQKMLIVVVAAGVVWGGLWYLQRGWISQDPTKIKVDPRVEREILALLEKSKVAKRDHRVAIFYEILSMGREGLPVLVHALCDKDPRVRAFVASILPHYGNVSVIPFLEARLKDESPLVRRSVLTALGHLGAVETVPAIILLLDDGDSFTRCQAALVLGSLGRPAAVIPLIETLGNDPYPIARQTAANSLGEIGSEKAVRPLINSLDDSNHLVRSASLIALNRITGTGLGPYKEPWTAWWNDRRPDDIRE